VKAVYKPKLGSKCNTMVVDYFKMIPRNFWKRPREILENRNGNPNI